MPAAAFDMNTLKKGSSCSQLPRTKRELHCSPEWQSGGVEPAPAIIPQGLPRATFSLQVGYYHLCPLCPRQASWLLPLRHQHLQRPHTHTGGSRPGEPK